MNPRPFEVNVPDDELAELAARLLRTRWPEEPTDPSQGIGVAALRPIVERWTHGYDWRRCERELVERGSSLLTIDGVDIHFLHARSSRSDARPLVLTHGWPGSVVEFLDVLPLLVEPDDGPAFHVVVPSLPGYGFSSAPKSSGWNVEKIADAWHQLMTALGYLQYLAQGGDWGAMVSTALLAQHPDACRAIHLNLVMATPPPDVLRDPTEEERIALADVKEHARRGAGYAAIQSTRPQTIGYGLVDSPIALAAWILDKFAAWTDGPDFGDIHVDRLLDNLTLWWVTRSAASAARLYWESYAKSDLGPVSGPVGCTIFPGELSRPSRRWAASRFEDLVYYAHAESGGHFAALEQPAQFAQQLRAFAAEVKDV